MTDNQPSTEIARQAAASIQRSRFLRGLLLSAVICGLPIYLYREDKSVGSAILLAVGIAWIILTMQARRKAIFTATASRLIATGQLPQARDALAQTFRGLCLHKSILLMASHNLSVVLQKQKQWLQVWQLCELVRTWAGRGLKEIRILSEAVRADCGLAINNLAGTYESLSVLSAMQLSVTERLGVLQTEVVYGIRVGRSDALMEDLPNKVALARLLPTEQAGIVHASLALAAHLAGQLARRNWLWEKAGLYCPTQELLAAQPGLQPLAQAINMEVPDACRSDDRQVQS